MFSICKLNFLPFSEYSRVDAGIKILLLLLAHRFLRNLNSTGDKYAHLPDIADWLLDQNHKIGLSLFFILGSKIIQFSIRKPLFDVRPFIINYIIFTLILRVRIIN